MSCFFKKIQHNNKGKGLNADRLHAKFDSYLDGLKMEEQYLEFLFHMIKEEYMQREGDKVLVSKNIEREIKEIEKNIDNVVNTITTSQSEIVRRKLEQKIEELEMTKHTLMNQLNRQGGPKIDTILNIALDICKDPLSIRKQGTIDEKRMFLKVVFRQNLPVNKKLEDFGTLPISALFALKGAYLTTNLPTFGPTTKSSEPIVAQYSELLEEIYRFGNFGLYMAREGSLEIFHKYREK